MSADGRLLGQLGMVTPTDPAAMTREDGVLFVAEAGFEPAQNARLLQGFVENSNVEPVTALARMIEVQRAYELGQSFLDSEDKRIREALSAMTRR